MLAVLLPDDDETAVVTFSCVTVPSNGAVSCALRMLYCACCRLSLDWSSDACAESRSDCVGVLCSFSKAAFAEETDEAALRTALSSMFAT